MGFLVHQCYECVNDHNPMSEEQLKAFWEAVQADTSLQEKLRATTDADSIASIAKEAGFEITADEVKEAQSELSEDQLSSLELGKVAAGWSIRSVWPCVSCVGVTRVCGGGDDEPYTLAFKRK